MKEFRYFAALVATGAVAITVSAYQADAVNIPELVRADWLALGAPDVLVVSGSTAGPTTGGQSLSRAEAKIADRAPASDAAPETASSLSRRDDDGSRVSTAPNVDATATSLRRRDDRADTVLQAR